jgi:hypothetical protein
MSRQSSDIDGRFSAGDDINRITDTNQRATRV